MFERCTERALHAVELARVTAREYGRPAVDSGLLLAGVLREGTGVAVQVLRRRGVDLGMLTRELQVLERPSGDPTRGPLRLTADCETVIRHAQEVSAELGHSYVGTEHLLLGMLRARLSAAAVALRRHHLTYARAQHEVLAFLRGESAAAPRRAPLDPLDRADWPRRRREQAPSHEQRQVRSVLPGDGLAIMPGRVLLLLPPDGESEARYPERLARLLARHGLEVQRVDRLPSDASLLAGLWREVRRAEVIFADVSGGDGRVMLGLGLALAAGRWPHLFARSEASRPAWLPAGMPVVDLDDESPRGLARWSVWIRYVLVDLQRRRHHQRRGRDRREREQGGEGG